MAEDLKIGDCVVNKVATDVKYTLSQIDINRINTICIDSHGKEITIPLIALTKCPEWKSPVYLG
ncbi:UNVERIFIED_CONTAM: hypothetical protein QOZ72_29005, partial [Pseudomonas aeruginosa]